jgi:hypothetical protein
MISAQSRISLLSSQTSTRKKISRKAAKAQRLRRRYAGEQHSRERTQGAQRVSAFDDWNALETRSGHFSVSLFFCDLCDLLRLFLHFRTFAPLRLCVRFFSARFVFSRRSRLRLAPQPAQLSCLYLASLADAGATARSLRPASSKARRTMPDALASSMNEVA